MRARPSTARPVNRRAREAEARQNRVLEQARRHFLKKGYAHTSLDSILEHSGGSKATLLKYFGSKAGLFAAVITESAKAFIESAHIDTLQGTPAEVLQTFGMNVLSFYLRPDSILIYRGVIAEGQQNPRMAQAFYNDGHAHIAATLAARLKQWHEQGLIHCPQPAADADRFLHILRSGLHERLLIGLPDTVTHKDILAQVSGSVRIFTGGLRR